MVGLFPFNRTTMGLKPPIFSLKIPDVPDFHPRRQVGDSKLTADQREMADILSIMEQKLDWYGDIAVSAFNLCALQARVLVAIVILLMALEGPRAINIALSWAGVKEPTSSATRPR